MILRAFQARPNSPPALCRREYPLELTWQGVKTNSNQACQQIFPVAAVGQCFFASKVFIRSGTGSAKMTAKEGYHGALHNQNK